jgi:hypothetical protein
VILIHLACIKGPPTRAILIAQYPVSAVIINGIGVVLKVCAMVEETLSEFDIYIAQTDLDQFLLYHLV